MREALQRPPAPVRRNPTASASPTALSTRADSRFGRSDWPLVFAASAAAMGCVGYFVRDLDFGPADSAVLVAVHGLGTALVALIGGAQRWRMLRVYWLYVIVAGLAFVAGTAYASPFGSVSPVFMTDRLWPRDDYNLWMSAIRPMIGARTVGLFDGQTNAPLHWYANVRVQELFVLLTGRPQLMVGNALNIVVGAITAALCVGAINVAVRPSARPRFPDGLRAAFVLACPWLVASSVIAIREVWVYAIFAAALYGGLLAARLSAFPRLVVLGGLAAVIGLACYLLREEMTPFAVALVLVAGITAPSRPLPGVAEAVLVAGVVVLTALSVVPALALREDTLSEMVEMRSQSYTELSEKPELGARGTVNSLLGDSVSARAVFQTLWLPINPLPRVMFQAGSMYQLGKVLTPIWSIAAIATALSLPRAPSRAPPEGSVIRRYRWLILWMLTMTVLVGVTSAETRHFYGILPVAALVLADIFQTRATGPAELGRAWRNGLRIGLWVLVLSALATLLVFDVDAMLPGW